MEKLNSVIENELARRIKRNPRYSLRSFAKTLGISHSLLSLVLSGKRPISRKLKAKLEEHLGVIPEIPPETPNGSVVPDSQQISLDAFALMADWYHYAILNLLETPHTTFDERFVSLRLEITRAEAGIALLRLKRLGMIEKRNGKWKRIAAPIKVENTNSTVATRTHHRQLLEKAAESLESDSFEIRDFSAVTMAIDPKLLPYARNKIQEFRRTLMRDLEARGNRTEVYHLAVQLYPVSKKREKK